MPRGVAKAKDGDVGKKDKGDGKVVVVGKRIRKMRGGKPKKFEEYCNDFVKDNRLAFNDAKDNIKKMFKNLKIIINNLVFKKEGSFLTRNNKKNERKKNIVIIDKIIQSDKNEDIDMEDLTKIFIYINTYITAIIEQFNIEETSDETKKIEEQIDKEKKINTNTIKKLVQDFLFLKIYKLFHEFAEISKVVAIISDIQIENGKDDRKRETLQAKDITPSLSLGWANDVNTESLQLTKKTADAENKGKEDSKSSQTSNKKTNIYFPNDKPTLLHLEDKNLTEQKLDGTKNRSDFTRNAAEGKQKASLTKSTIYNKETTIREFKEINKLLINTEEYKRIISYYDSLRTENINENFVRNIIDDILWKTYNNVINYFEGEHNIVKIHPFILDLSIENVEKNHKSNIDTIKSLSQIDDTKKGEMIQYVIDAKNLSLTYNEMYKEILEKYLAYLVSDSISDEESVEDDNLVEEAKITLMMLINENTKKAVDESIYKKFEKIRDDLDENDEFENYIKKVLKDLLFQKINDILDLLDSRDHTKEKIEDFLLRVDDETIREETKQNISKMNDIFSNIDTRTKDSKKELINNVKEELIRLFSIFRPEIKGYIELLRTQKEQDNLQKQESTDVSDIQQDPSNPLLLEKQNPLNVSRNPSASLRPIHSEYSELFSHIDKLQIDDNNEKKKDTAKSLKENYIYYIKIIKRYLLSNAKAYYTDEQYMEKVKTHFDYIIDKAFKILNFDAITYIKSELLLLENYNRDYTNRTFDIMRGKVNERYGDTVETGYNLKINVFHTITLLQTNLNEFNFKCYDLLNVLYMNNKEDKTWTGGGQPRKSQRKEHINNTGAMKKKLTTKDPKANEPTKTPKAKDPKPKEPITKTPKAKDPKPKEPITKTPKIKEPKTKEPKTKEPTKTPKQKEPTKTPKIKEPTKTPKQKEPTKTPKQKEPKKTPKPKEPTKTPKQKEPTKTPKIKEPTKTPKQKEPKAKDPNAKKPTKTPKAKEPKPTKK